MPSDKELYQALTANTAYDDKAKKAFHSAARTLLRRLSKELGNGLLAPYGEHDPIRSNKGGIAVSGEVTLHYDRLYVQVSQSCLGAGHEVMFRTCNGRGDYTGGRNHFASAETLIKTKDMADMILRLCEKRSYAV